jgi:hypothetical protein
MIRALLPYLLTAIIAVILRDVECFVAAKVFCWRKRRQTQREARENRELRELQAKLIAAEELEKNARIAKRLAAAPKVPFPQLVDGPLIITARSKEEVYTLCRQVSSNIASRGTRFFSDSNFEEN